MRTYTLIAGAIVLVPVILIPTLKEVSFLAGFGLAASMISIIEVVMFAFIIPELTSHTVDKFNLPVPPTFRNVTQHDIVRVNGLPDALLPLRYRLAGTQCFHPLKSVFEMGIRKIVQQLLDSDPGTLRAPLDTSGTASYSPILCNFSRGVTTTLGMLTAVTKLFVACHVMSAYPI